MTRNLRVLGLCLTAVFALSALTASAAQAEVSSAAKFTAAVGATETAKIDGEQVGTNTFILNGLKLTCNKIILKGTASAAGTSATEVTLEPTYEECDVEVPEKSGVKKLVTVTVNGCAFVFNATTTETTGGVKEFTADTAVQCPIVNKVQKKIEIHVYNSATSEAETLCTWDVGPQTGLKETKLTNETGTPDDILAHVLIPSGANGVATERTVGSATACGAVINHAEYVGTATLRATNAVGAFVNATVSE